MYTAFIKWKLSCRQSENCD